MALLAGKKIVVIGGTTGIGLSAVKSFVTEGAKVVAVGIEEENLSEVRSYFGEEVEVIMSDARKIETAANAVNVCIEKFGGFDGLYHVAGGSGRKMGDGPLHELSLEGWNKTLELNLTSVMLSNQAAIKKIPGVKKRGNDIKYGIGSWVFSIAPIFFNTCLCRCKGSYCRIIQIACRLLRSSQYTCECNCSGPD